jgi:phosphate transport system substrate-binding protein
MSTISMKYPPPARTAIKRRRALAACAAFALTGAFAAQAAEIKIGGTGAALGTMQVAAKAFAAGHPETKFTVLPSLGSGGGIKALLAGAVELAVSSRPLSEAEIRAGAVGVEYGRTPFVFATAATNRATGITTQNLVDFYAGTLDQWPDGTKLRLVLRPIGDSDSETIKNMSAAMREAKSAAEQRKGMVFTVTDQDTANGIESIAGALGPSTLALILSEKRPLKALALDGVVPSPQSLANGSYPLARSLWIVTGPKTPAEGQAFIGFLRSPEGRELLRQTGHWVK